MRIDRSNDIPSDLKGALDSFPFRGPDGLHTPELGDLEKKYLTDCIDSGYVSSVGPYVEKFEAEIARFSDAREVVATSSGTTALHLALRALGVQPGDVVIVPAITFVATANAVSHCGATPLALDVESQSMGLDAGVLSEFLGSQTICNDDGSRMIIGSSAVVRAVIAVHVLGHPCDIESIAAVCVKFGVMLLEDAAESLGSSVGDIHTGLFGAAGILSFNGNKTITTGGGGCVLTNDGELAARIRHLATTARIPHPFEFDHDAVGYNYRMPNINAALGCAQMERLPGLLSAQRELYEHYRDHFAEVESVELLSEPPDRRSNFWLQAFRLRRGKRQARDAVLDYGSRLGIPLRPLWKPVPSVNVYRLLAHEKIPVASKLYDSVVCLPSSPSLLSSVVEFKGLPGVIDEIL